MSKITKAAVSLMIATILSKILGFVRELTLASVYGTSAYSDAYLIALNIPTIIFACIGTALATSYIPLFYKIKEEREESNGIEFTNNLINIVIVICTLLIIIGFIFTENIVKLFAIGFQGQTLSLTINFTRVLLIGMVFMALTYIISSYLQAKEEFLIPGLIGIPYNIIVIASIFLSSNLNIHILVYGTLIAMASQFVYQFPSAYKKGFKYKPNLDIKDENIKKMLYLVIPVFIGVSVNQINALVDRTLASTLVEGSISALNYANRLNGFVIGLFIASISSVLYPILSNLSAKNSKQNFINALVKSINIVIIIMIPTTVAAITLATPIVKFLFQRGAFDFNATKMTSIALVYYSIGMVAFGLRDILSRAFYALQDTKTPMINGAIAMILNIILNLILVRYMAHGGLALATSISSLICIGLLFISLRRKIGSFGENKIFILFLKSSLASIVMGVIVKITYNYIHSILKTSFINEALTLGITVITGVSIYTLLINLLKVDEVNLILDKIKDKVFKSK